MKKMDETLKQHLLIGGALAAVIAVILILGLTSWRQHRVYFDFQTGDVVQQFRTFWLVDSEPLYQETDLSAFCRRYAIYLPDGYVLLSEAYTQKFKVRTFNKKALYYFNAARDVATTEGVEDSKIYKALGELAEVGNLKMPELKAGAAVKQSSRSIKKTPKRK